MSDEDEVERFEVTDYDLSTEFNPGRFRRKQTKSQAIYGVFAPEDSDEEGGRPGIGRGPKERKSYTSGVAFVSGGLQKPVVRKEDEKIEDEEEVHEISDSSSEDEFQIMAKSIGKNPTLQDFGQIAGLRNKNAGHSSKGMGLYGIGAKMAMKMGYQPGKGLGKDLQGISAPIEAVVRKGRGAIGAYGKETKSRPAENTIGDPLAPPAVQVPKEQKWQKTREGAGAGVQKKDKVEYRYMTADEVLEQKQLRVRPDAGFLAKTKVIDLTGPETRILSGYHAISGQKRPEDEWEGQRREEDQKFKIRQKSAFEMPELLHNVGLLLDNCEQDILKNDKKAKYASDREVQLREEQIRIKKTLEHEERLAAKLESLIEEIRSLTQPGLDLDSAFLSLAKLKNEHGEEWEMYQLHSLVPGMITPLLKDKLKESNILTNPRVSFQAFSDWKNLLGSHQEAFDALVWEAWMPPFRVAHGYWNVKDANSMLTVLEIWNPLLPGWIYANILDQMVLPKINEGVDAWDPLSDNIPIHAWIHPWLPILGAKLEIVYPTIRRKLANALVQWHPSDASGKQILTPWVTVFSKGSMDAFVLKNILPKLQLAMQSLVINPNQQVLDQWKWVMDWQEMIPLQALLNLLETFFFPKLLQYLVTWLNQRPNYDEVYRWYTWWRGIIPETLLRESIVTENLQKALQMINAAIQNPGQPMDFSYILGRPGSSVVTQQQPPPPPLITPELMADAIRMTSQVPHGFRDLVQMKCEELGLVFVPMQNKYYEGKQVYRCGRVLVYISANVIYIQRDGVWIPTSLEKLIQAATMGA